MKWALDNYYLHVEFSSMGGALSSVMDRDGIEYLWQGDADYWSGQAPVLFPICGSLRDDRARLQNGEWTWMPRHGLVRKKEFTCDFCSDDTIQFSIRDDGEMYSRYPYHFRLVISYELAGKSIRVRYTVCNENTQDMPFFIGGHPGFRCPILPGERFEDYQIEFERNETLDLPEPDTQTGLINISKRRILAGPTDILPLNHELFHRDALILDQISSRRVRMCHKSNRRGVEIEFQDFPYLILWSSANDGPFVAMEPWSGLSTCSDEDDWFESKRNVQKARPGERRQLSFSLGLI